jgi:hypothetical protein
MRRKTVFFLTIALIGALGWTPQLMAKSQYLTQFTSKYGSSSISTCALCHQGSPPALNPFGSDFASASIGNHTFNSALESRDSDGDGFSNLAEINAHTFPGDPSSKPAATDTTPPTVTSFSIPSTSSSLTVPITSFVATDNVGVTGYALSESGSAPASGWSGSAPSSYTFSSAGNKTLYAWARDAAGNVSSPKSAQVSITLPPPPPPEPGPPPSGEGVEAWVDRWMRLTIFLRKGHDWSELGLLGEENKLTTYLQLEGWDSQSQVLSGLLYLEPGSDEEDLQKGAPIVLPLDFLVISSSQKEFWATSQFTEEPSTVFTARFKGKLVKGELKPGILQSKHKQEGEQETKAWFWLKGKLIDESQVPEDILTLSAEQKSLPAAEQREFPMNFGGNFD